MEPLDPDYSFDTLRPLFEIRFIFQSSFIGAIAIGDLVKSTMGPKGMDKILVSMGQDGYPGDIQVTDRLVYFRSRFSAFKFF